jgi:hypothetical protein
MTIMIEFNKAKEIKNKRMEMKLKHYPTNTYEETLQKEINRMVEVSTKSMNLVDEISNEYEELRDKYEELVERYSSDVQKLSSGIQMLIEHKESALIDYTLAADYILDREYLHDDYVAYLKSLKSFPEWEGQRDNIETLLTEFGADERTERYLEEEMKNMSGGV